MSNDIFEIRNDELDRLIKQYRVNAKEFRSAIVNVLNSQAFGTKTVIPQVMQNKMTIRNARFVNSSIRVMKATARDPIAMVGSITRPGFSGWVEQQTGRKADRNRISTKAARRGNWRNRIAPSLRMKTSNVFISDKSIIQTSNSASQRTAAMLSYVERKNYRKPFILSGSKRFKKGLYKRVGRKIKLIQRLQAPRQTVKRVPWMTVSRTRYFRQNSQVKVWSQSIERIVSFRRKR